MPREASATRRKMLLGVVLAVGIFPSLLVLASLFWFRGNAPWELVRTYPLRFIEMWLHAGVAKLSGEDATAAALSGGGGMKMVGLFISALFKGMTPVFALFMCIGVAGWFQTWKRREHQAIFYMVLLFFLAIWIHMNVLEETSKRYFLPVAMVMSPFAGLGLLSCCRQLVRWAEGRRWGLAASRLASWLPLLLFALLSLGNVAISDYHQRAGQAELGRWTRDRFGPSPMLLAPSGVAQVLTYYAGGHYRQFATNDDDCAIEDLMRQGPFDIVLLPEQHETSRVSDLLRYAAGLGYGPIDNGRFSDKLRKMVVLVRRNSAGRAR